MKKMIAAAMFAGLAWQVNAQAAAVPSVAGTSWDLSGTFGGSASVDCTIGGAHAVPILAQKNLRAMIEFNDGKKPGNKEGKFTWSNDDMHFGTASGSWEQKGTRLTLEFDHWNDSPLGAFAFGLLQAQSYIVGGPGYSASITDLEPTKLSISGSLNARGTALSLAEATGFSFTGSGSAFGSSNQCDLVIKLARKYKGTSITP